MKKQHLKELKKIGMSKSPVFNIGKNDLSNEQIISINQYLDKHELVKIKMLQSSRDNKSTIIDTVVKNTNSILIDSIGGVFVIYRKKED